MENRQIIYIHILLALLTAVIIYIGLRPLTDVPDSTLIMDAFLSGIILSGLLMLLKNVIKYGHFSFLHIRQRLINYSALAILFVVCWLGIEFLIMYLSVSEKDWDALYKTVPIRIIISFLIYGMSVMFFGRVFEQESTSTQIEDVIIDEDLMVSDNPEGHEQTEIIERIAVKSGQKIEVIPISEIIYLQAEGDYVMIHSTNGKYLKEQTMKSLESSLPADKFVRVHRSSIINVGFIAQIELYDKQTQLLKLKNGAQVRASLAGYRLLKKTLGL